jgi:hypothetical protein
MQGRLACRCVHRLLHQVVEVDSFLHDVQPPDGQLLRVEQLAHHSIDTICPPIQGINHTCHCWRQLPAEGFGDRLRIAFDDRNRRLQLVRDHPNELILQAIELQRLRVGEGNASLPIDDDHCPAGCANCCLDEFQAFDVLRQIGVYAHHDDRKSRIGYAPVNRIDPVSYSAGPLWNSVVRNARRPAPISSPPPPANTMNDRG